MSRRPKPLGIPELIEYRGWLIWGWTGWKGEKSTAMHTSDCRVCSKPVYLSETIYISQTIPTVCHWACKYPDNRPDTYHAQWLASKDGERFLYAECAPVVMAELPAGEYKRGESFRIVPHEIAIGEDTDEEIKEAAKQNGFERLKFLIDEIESEYEPSTRHSAHDEPGEL